MSSSIPRQPAAHDAARVDSTSTPPTDRPLPQFQPHTPSPYSPIEREIERSERASAALAATRALARASFTDSQLVAEEAAGPDADDDFDASGWARTEHVAFDPRPQGDGGGEPAPRHLVGGSFNPGIASQQGRLFPGASIARAPIRTRSGATGRFAQESRHAPRGEHAAAAVARAAPQPATERYQKPAVMPLLTSPATAPLAAKARARARSRSSEPAGFLLAAALGAAVVLVGGGVAWNAGLLSRGPDNMTLVTPAVAAQAEAARLLSEEHDIPIAPAAGLPAQHGDAEVDAAFAAAVPASVAAPARASAARRATPRAKDNVDKAIANARARADRFLAPEGSSGAARVPPTEVSPPR